VAARAITDGHQIDILAVPSGRGEVNLVQDRAAAHRDLLAQERVAEDRAYGTRDEKVLLDLRSGRPSCMRGPIRDLTFG